MSFSSHHSFFTILRDAFIVALLTVLALALAYQVQTRVVIDVGGKWDAPFVARFFDAEGDAEQTYRWTRTQSRIELEGQNVPPPWTLRVRMNGYRPSGSARVQVQMNGALVDEFQARDGWHVYEMQGDVAAEAWSGNQVLTISNDTFVPAKEIENSIDTRKLGVATDWIELVPARGSLWIGNDDAWLDFARVPLTPPFGVLLSWGLAFGLLYATARGIGLSKRAVNIAFAFFILALACGFTFARLYLGYFTTTFLVLAIALALLAFLFVSLVPRFAARIGLALTPSSLTILGAILLVSIGLKWSGVWYPQFRSSDLLFHAHRLEFVSQGELFFTSELPDAARRVVPYPPALYVFLTPFTAFTREYSMLLLGVNVLADALAILAIYFAARKVFNTNEGRPSLLASLFSAFLFAFNPVSFWIYSWGNHTNIFGQDVATILFALLLTQSAARPRNFLLMLFLFVLASVSHLGIFFSLLLFFPLAIVFRFFSRAEDARRESLWLLALLGTGLVLMSGLYYAEFSGALITQTQNFFADLGAGRTAGSGGVTFARVGDVARYTSEQLGWVLLVVGIAGAPLAWKQFSARARAMWGAWLLVGFLFALVTLGASFSTRYTLWVTPTLALSGGLLLAWLFEKSRAAQFAVYALCGLAFAQTLWLWFDRVWNAYH